MVGVGVSDFCGFCVSDLLGVHLRLIDFFQVFCIAGQQYGRYLITPQFVCGLCDIMPVAIACATSAAMMYAMIIGAVVLLGFFQSCALCFLRGMMCAFG